MAKWKVGRSTFPYKEGYGTFKRNFWTGRLIVLDTGLNKGQAESVVKIMNAQEHAKRRLRFIFAWYDLWIGFFWDRKKHWLYIFPIPCVGIIIKFKV